MPRRQKQHHYIYKTTCLVTGKFYVGMHSTDDLDDSYLGSGKILRYSILKHGIENHKKEILEHCPSREALKLREKEIVNEALLADPLNINLKYGGEGGWDHIDFTPFSNPELQAELAKRANVKLKVLWKDPAFADPIKAKISASLQGHQGFIGRSHSDDTKLKMSLSAKTRSSGDKNTQFGTCWMIKDDRPVKIKLENLDEYLANGYSRGRK